VRGAPTPLRHRAHIELVLEFSGFKREAQNFWHSPLSSANRLLSPSYFVRAGIFLLEILQRSNKIMPARSAFAQPESERNRGVFCRRRTSMSREKLSPIIPSLAPETFDLALDRLLAPARHFKHPYDVLSDATLDLQEKRAILSSWASDACAVESMPALRQPPGAEQPISFDQIMDTLRQLDSDASARQSASCEFSHSFDRLDA